MEQLGELLQLWGEKISEFGFEILPYSFLLFVPLRFVEHIWRKVIVSKLVKSIWYFANGILTIFGDASLELLVAFVLIIEAVDHFFDFCSKRRELTERQKDGESYNDIDIC